MTRRVAVQNHILLDEEDEHLLTEYNWYIQTKGNISYVCAMNKRKVLYLHRMVMNANSKQVIDHINRNGLDNRKTNLRFVDKSKNAMNSKKRENCSSKFKGVWFSKAEKRIKRWCAYINLAKKRKHLGWFLTEIEAAKAYNLAASQLYGEYACLNAV